MNTDKRAKNRNDLKKILEPFENTPILRDHRSMTGKLFRPGNNGNLPEHETSPVETAGVEEAAAPEFTGVDPSQGGRAETSGDKPLNEISDPAAESEPGQKNEANDGDGSRAQDGHETGITVMPESKTADGSKTELPDHPEHSESSGEENFEETSADAPEPVDEDSDRMREAELQADKNPAKHRAGLKVINGKNNKAVPAFTGQIPDTENKIDIERLKRRIGDTRLIEHRRVMLPDTVESVSEQTFEEITQADRKTEVTPETKEVSVSQTSWLSKVKGRFERKKIILEDYDVNKHGPLVNLELGENTPYQEIELYQVNEPYAYIRIAYNPTAYTYRYQVLEPVLRPAEKELFLELKIRLTETLDINLKHLEESGARKYLMDKVTDLLWDYQIKIDTISFTKIMYYIYTEFMGYGKIDPLMRDKYLEDISCDGPHTPLYVYHKKFESIETDVTFENEAELDAFVVRIAQICGRHISIADPLLDATMPDGSRIQMTLGREVTTRGSSFTIRKFKESPLTPPDLIDLHTYSTAIIAYLWLAAENNKNMIFAGGTASGKTTAMNAVALFIPPETKIVTIEDTRELNLPHPNWIAGVTRETFTGGESGSIDMYDLLRAALRQRPEYMLVGEVRGAEAYVLFQAMSTGHTTFSTMHADSITSVVHRLENPPINVPRIMLQALDIVIVQIQTTIDDQRVRRAKSITELVGVDARTGELLTNQVFTWTAQNDDFSYSGRSYVLESIKYNRGWDDGQLKEELKRRQEILEWARLKNVTHYEDVAKIVVTYYREPEKLMEIVRTELYGSQ